MKTLKLFMAIPLTLFLVVSLSCNSKSDWKVRRIRDTKIEDFLLHQLYIHRILVIPECLSHDSFDAIRLPMALIRRWCENDNNIKKLIVGLETEECDYVLNLIQNNSYYKQKRFATFCPPGWALFSTKGLSEYLFYHEVKKKYPDRFDIFGFENSFLYYDSKNKRYLLPSQIDSVQEIEKIPVAQSRAPFIIKYIYSRFFRDFRSFMKIKEMIKNNPDGCFIIIIGNAHTCRKFYFEETDVDRQIIEAYKIDKEKYWHTVGYFLKQNYDPVFIQSNIDSTIERQTLFLFDSDSLFHNSFKPFYTDFVYSIPAGTDVNLEDEPLVCIPSLKNLELLRSKNFQIYPNDEYIGVVKRLIYFMTGVYPEVKLDEPGRTGSCSFMDPQTGEVLDFDRFVELIPEWYINSTFIKRLNEDVGAYNHRSLFRAIFKLMGKTDLTQLSAEEENEFTNHLLSLLSVIGSEEEQYLARLILSRQLGSHEDYYSYYKMFYYKKYSSN